MALLRREDTHILLGLEKTTLTWLSQSTSISSHITKSKSKTAKVLNGRSIQGQLKTPRLFVVGDYRIKVAHIHAMILLQTTAKSLACTPAIRRSAKIMIPVALPHGNPSMALRVVM